MNTSSDQSPQLDFGSSHPVVDRICEHLRSSDRDNPEVLCHFAREFFAKVPLQMLAERSIDDLAALTAGAFDFLERLVDDPVEVEVVNPEEEGWTGQVTVIRAEMGDRPFIVDTIREHLSSENLPILHYAYPLIGVERDAGGRIQNIVDATPENARALIHCEVPRIDDADRRRELEDEITRRLCDVVAATDDFSRMLAEVDAAAEVVRGYAERFPDRAPEMMEIDEFLRWLRNEHFVFLGYRRYEIVRQGGDKVLRVEPDSGLGILRDETFSGWARGIPLAELAPELSRRVTEGPVLLISKTNAESTVHRRARMDYIGIKRLDDQGNVAGELRFLGLFTSKAYAESAEEIPILREKLASVLQASEAQPGSHDYKEIITIFNSMPREDLFQASTEDLAQEAQSILGLLFSDEVQVSLRPDPLGRGVSVMVILPRGRFSGEIRQRIQEVLKNRFAGEVLDYHLAMGAGDQARLHFHVAADRERIGQVDADEVADDIRDLIRSWDDHLREGLRERFGPADSLHLATLYGKAFDGEYRAATPPEIGVQDVETIEKMVREGTRVSISIRPPHEGERADKLRDLSVLKLYLMGERLILSDFMPVLDNSGLRVIEVTPFTVARQGVPAVMIYSFVVQDPEAGKISPERGVLLAEALLAVRAGDTQSDHFSVLVLRAGLRWREVDLMRLYGNFAFQAGLLPTRYATARALARYPRLAQLLLESFCVRFDPASATAGEDSSAEAQKKLRARIMAELDKVTTLVEDRAVRRVLNLIDATVRTNYYAHGAAEPTRRSGGVPYISVKIRSGDVEELRHSRLLFEVFVSSSRMEGIHLRAAPVSRGGIRWSDRNDDFRTEVLGLAHTQIVKNAVIVPSGSKGGFIVKNGPTEREARMADGAEQYRTLMRGLLDLTDNLVDGQIVPPPGVIRYDKDDPYLVVAADKGTSHLSDVANAVAAEYGFWLGDAFASGGSNGYDHKKEGITARGAWECVKRHFREMGKNIQVEPFTVAGIGDMSGDVFGNGMLLSRTIRLVAAFDHRNVFIDPDPDPEASFVERERLFNLPRSSWEDYDRSRLSAGSMVVSRTSKAIELTPEARAVLGLGEDVETLDGEGLVRAVLMAPVELLWNGGIGTYVKAASETHGEVGDTTNDAVRIDAEELRCKVVGEGGNLGFTQRARVDFARRGGRINTDALDNSAGVDMSDHEVNLKILLGPVVAAGEMTTEQRNSLLEQLTADVSRLVLRNNIEQSLAVSLDEARSREAVADFAPLIATLEREKLIDREEDGIPDLREVHTDERGREGLPRPTLCVLLAHAKLQAKSQLLASTLVDGPAAERYLAEYFPPGAVAAVGPERLRQHRLRREIVATEMVNDLVGLMGASFLHRIARETARPIADVTAAWFVANEISGAAKLREQLGTMEDSLPAETLYRWEFGLARVLERTTRWVLTNGDTEPSLDQLAQGLSDGLSRLRDEFGTFVSGEDRALFEQLLEELKGIAEPELAQRLVTLRFLPELLDILQLAREFSFEPIETARAFYLVSERQGIDWLQRLRRSVPQKEGWERRLALHLGSDLHGAQRHLTRDALRCHREGGSIEECLNAIEKDRATRQESYRATLEELRRLEQPTLAAVAVGVRALLELAEP